MLILASASPRRQQIVSALGLRFETRTCRTEPEPEPGEAPTAYALRAARAKTASVAGDAGADDWVLGADTVVAIGGTILGKPRDDADARRMIEMLSGQTHLVTTAFCLMRGAQEHAAEAVTTRVTFSALSAARIDGYVGTGEGRDKAGAYAIQGAGMALIRSIEGSYSNVVGLPAAEVLDALERAGAIA